MKATKGSYEVSNRLAIDTFDEYLPADLLCLLCALPRMPSVRKFGISDSRWSDSIYCWQDRREYARLCKFNDEAIIVCSEKVGGRQTVQIHPQEWPHSANRHAAHWEHSKSWYRGFHVLTQAASMLDLRQLRSFTVGAATESIVSYTILEMTNTELMHTCNAFRHLASIDLHIDARNGNPEWNWAKVLDGGNVAQVLTSIKGLKHLDLGFEVRDTEVPELAKLLGPSTWPSLRYLGLRNMVVEEDELVAFVTRHSSTIESIYLEFVMLFKRLYPEVAGWTPKSWKGAFRSMSELALTDLGVTMPLSDGELYSMQGFWHSNDSAEINRFLVSGGDTWFAKNELKYDQEQQQQWLEAQRENEQLDREWVVAH